MSLRKALYPMASTGLTQEDRKMFHHNRKTVKWGVKHHHKQNRERSGSVVEGLTRD